jgi:hypothetical protein
VDGAFGDEAQRAFFRKAPRATEVHTIHAEVEGRSKAGLFEKILDDWLGDGVTFPLRRISRARALARPDEIPVRDVVPTALRGRGGTVATGWPAAPGASL